MKRVSKGIISIAVIGLGVGIGFSFKDTKLKVEDLNSKKLAVFIKQEDGSYKTSNNIPQVGYTLNTSKSTCSNGVRPTWNNNNLSLGNLTSENTNCYLYFDEEESTKQLNKLGLTANNGTPDFSQVATTDEGVYAAEDGMYGGTSYYWRGAVTNNYVQFAGFCWRIIRINGDGSLRLIYDGATCHANGTSTTDSIAVASVKYNSSSNQSNYVGWTYEGTKQRPTDYATSISSNAKTQLESWYLSNIGTNATYASKVADGKFCNDRNVGSGYTWGLKPSKKFYYIGPTRLYINKTPSLLCDSDDIYTLKVGLITADEVAYAGGKALFFNNLYYLNNDQNYWTITPAEWNTSSIGD